jgi:hypothetical protein
LQRAAPLRGRFFLVACLLGALLASRLPLAGPGVHSAAQQFSDRTEQSGISFLHVRGSSGKKYMVETLGSGAGFLDYDQDGWLDLYLVNGASLPGHDAQPPPVNALYRNNGDGSFTDVTLAAGVGHPGYGMGCAVGDYDNDGHPDLYVTNFGADVLYRNNGDGTFTDVTRRSGVGSELWGASAGFGDIDADGDLDLYVVNYVDFTLENHKRCGNPGLGLPDYCHPQVYNGLPDVLFRNNGDGTFSDVTREAGVYAQEGKGLGVVFGDYDDDGDSDIYVANDSTPNFLWRNDGRGRFEEVGMLSGVALDEEGRAEAGMGVDFGDFDNDGDLDIFVTNLVLETNTLYLNLGNGFFEDATARTGMAEPSLPYVGFGTGFFDYDNDSDLDVFIANGHILDTVDLLKGTVTYEQPNLLMRNQVGRFEDVSAQSGPHFAERRASRGAAFGDYDNDGDVDVLVTNSNRPPALLRNDGGNQGRKLMVLAVGSRGNRDAIGARLWVTAGRRQMREVHGAYSYLSHSDLRVAFGIGGSATVEKLEIRWPGGPLESFANLAADQLIVIKQGRGIVSAVPLPNP